MDWIHGAVEVEVKEPDPQTGKPYLAIALPNGQTICLTLTIAEMVGSVAKGARERYEQSGSFYQR